MGRKLTFKPIPKRLPGLSTWIQRLGVQDTLVVPYDGGEPMQTHVRSSASAVAKFTQKTFEIQKMQDGSVSVERVK
jgi:hypothetical protein